MRLAKLVSQACTGRYLPAGDHTHADCVLGFAFGAEQQGERLLPGETNAHLAQLALQNYPTLPKILQGEIADAYPQSEQRAPSWVIHEHRKPGRYLDTREVAAQAAEIVRREGFDSVVLLAQPYHVPRAAAVCRRLGIKPIVPTGLETIGFCPHSTQPWTRSRGAWICREIPTIAFYVLRRWI